MTNFAGVFYDRAGGNANVPLNNYTDYSNPVPADPATPPNDGDIRTVAVSVRTSFAVDNIELNFLRLPMSCGCGAPVCNSGCGGYGDGGLGGYGGCGGCGGCEQACCCSPFTMTGLCGVRFLRIDDDFRFGDCFRLYDSVNGNADGTHHLRSQRRQLADRLPVGRQHELLRRLPLELLLRLRRSASSTTT